MGEFHAQFEILTEGLLSVHAEAIILLREHELGDRQQFHRRIIGEVDMMGDTRTHAGITLEKPLHLVLVAGQDHYQVVAVVFHDLQQDLDGFLTVIALVLRLVEIIGLVDEQHPAHGLLDDFLGLGRRVSDVLTNQIVTSHRDQMAFAHIAEPLQYFAHAHRHRGLAGARIAGETHVQRRGLGAQFEFLAQAVDQQQGGDLADAGLDGLQTDQLVVELVQDLLNVGGFEFGLEVHPCIFRNAGL